MNVKNDEGLVMKCVIVEDEILSAESLSFLIKQTSLDLVGLATSGPDAVEMIDTLKPDVVFMDVKIPGISGLKVAALTTHKPHIVFTTAYAQHAVTAFELGAVDYLLKPYDNDRFNLAIERVQTILQSSQLPREASRVSEMSDTTAPLKRVYVRRGVNVFSLHLEEVERITVAGGYCSLLCGDNEYLIGISLTELEKKLDCEQFIRLNRTTIVNIRHVENLMPNADRRFRVCCSNGDVLIASRSISKTLRSKIL